jgi:hypothetical protein
VVENVYKIQAAHLCIDSPLPGATLPAEKCRYIIEELKRPPPPSARSIGEKYEKWRKGRQSSRKKKKMEKQKQKEKAINKG